jgi:hypothetical protein
MATDDPAWVTILGYENLPENPTPFTAVCL